MRLLIADDEDYVREGLISSIFWDKYGIDEIMQARDGREALTISSCSGRILSLLISVCRNLMDWNLRNG